jgi:acetate kinase
MPAHPILILNTGSSTLKIAVEDSGRTTASGLAERLNTPEATLTLHRDGQETTRDLPHADLPRALRALTDLLGTDFAPAAVGHRIVHGGERFTTPTLVDDDVLAGIEALAPLAPLHNSAQAAGIRVARDLYPGVPQVAVFDTAFHHTIPRHAHLYALPYELYEHHAIRRYGFHGTSHHYVALRAAEVLARPIDDLQLLTAHLGNGCSACAIRDGRSVDTTMGLTPLEGLVMGTRSGDVDPNLHGFLANNTTLDLPAITELLNKKSGLLGISGLSNDLRTLSQAAATGHERAALAIDIFCYRLAKGLLGLTAALTRLDAIVFTGGIGENSSQVREKTTTHLRLLGTTLDPTRNATHGKTTNHHISPEDAPLPLLVIPTDEEQMIAQATATFLPPNRDSKLETRK